MARLTVSQIMEMIASTVNQEATAPTIGGSEYSLWLSYLDRSQDEWAEANDWDALRKRYWPSVTGTSTATIALPSDFKKLAATPLLWGDGDYPTQYPEIRSDQEQMLSNTDNYSQVWGDITNGYNLIMNPGTLASGASLYVEYFANPTTISAATQIPMVTDPMFLVDRTIAYIFEARSDPRFQPMETKARERLLNMIDNANDAKYNSYANPNPVISSIQKTGFRVGRD